MYTPPVPIYLRQPALARSGASPPATTIRSTNQPAQVMQELEALGASRYGLKRSASRYLPRILHPDEHIGGIAYGRAEHGSVMLVATDRRIIFLEKKPLFVSEDEVKYDVVSGVSCGYGLFASTVTLHTRIRDYKVHTFNKACTEHFVRYIETRCLEQATGGQS